jgi:pterin-4a-carbinolamine dehydratase
LQALGVDSPELEQIELFAQLSLSGWSITLDKNAVQQLAKEYKFTNFAQALSFINYLGALAEEGGVIVPLF